MQIPLNDATRRIVIIPGETSGVGTPLVPDTQGLIDVGIIQFELSGLASNAPNRRVDVSVGDFFANGRNPLGIRWGKFWGGIKTPLQNGNDDARVTIRLCACVGNGIGGEIDVEELVRLETGTEIKAPVHANLAFDGITRIQAQQIYEGADITIDSGNVASVVATGSAANPQFPFAIGGDLRVMNGNLELLQSGTENTNRVGNLTGRVEVPNGSVTSVNVYNGGIKPPTGGTSLRINAGRGIGTIRADSVSGDIITNSAAGLGGTEGYIERLTISGAGSFVGNLTTRGLGLPGDTTAGPMVASTSTTCCTSSGTTSWDASPCRTRTVPP